MIVCGGVNCLRFCFFGVFILRPEVNANKQKLTFACLHIIGLSSMVNHYLIAVIYIEVPCPLKCHVKSGAGTLCTTSFPTIYES